MEGTSLIRVLFVFSCFQTNSADMNVLPRYSTSFVGDHVVFICVGVSVPRRSIYWIHRPAGETYDSYIFAGSSGILDYYKLERRHDVTFDESARTSQLVIKNISLEDAGTYAISLDSGELSQADLVVIKSAPLCSSNISLSSILVDNDCSLEPDHIRLDCSVASHGNRPPVLEWRHSMDPDVIIPGDGTTSIHSVHLRPEFRWNRTNFICSIKDLQPTMQRGACDNQNISVEYFFKSTKFAKIGKIANVSCLANTSEQCSYEWRATEVRTNNPVDIHGQTLQLIPQYFELFNDVRCFATCNIRGRVCTAQPMELKLSMEEETNSDDNLLLKILLPVLLILGLVAVVTVVFMCCRKSRSFKIWIHKKQRNVFHTNADLNEMQALDPNSVAAMVDFIRVNEAKLVECLDTENGFADCLISKGVLTAEQHSRVINRTLYPLYRDQNRALLGIVLPILNSESTCTSFMEALIETDQTHIYNFIRHTDNQARIILSADELHRIDRHTLLLVSLLDVKKKNFLDSLVDDGCITNRHRNRINAMNLKEDQNRELLSIIRRRSYTNFVAFIDALQRTKQKKVAVLLEQQTGNVIPVHCETSAIEGEVLTSSEDIKEIETKISELLNNTRVLSRKQKQSVARQLKELSQQYLIHLMAAYPTGSIVIYFLCQKFRSIVVLKGMIDSGQMKNILEDIFNCVLKTDSIRLKLNVSLELEEYQKRIQEARTTIYLETEPTKRRNRDCFMRSLPREMLELILLESMVGIMSVDWMANVRDNESVFGGYNLYEIVAHKSWMSAYISLKSVTHPWMHGIYLNKRLVLKQVFLRRLHQNYATFAEQLNCRYVLLDRLVEEKVITDEEKKNILQDETHFKSRIYKYIPEYIWPLVESDKQMLTSNEKLIACLNQKNYFQILKFLQLMEENCSTHVLNYFISNQHLQTFGDVWPLDEITRLRMTNRQQNIVKGMEVLIRMEDLEKCDKKGKVEKENGGTKEDTEGDDDDDEEKVEDVGGDDEDEEEDEFVEKEDADVGKEVGNRKKEKEGEDRERKEYESEDNEGMKEKSKHHRTTMDGSNQGIDEFYGNLRKIEEGERRENVDVEEDVDLKGEEDVSEEDAISDENEFEVGTTTEHMRSRWISHVDDESIPDSVNLIDLLYNEGCISIRHKQQIEQQPTQQLKNIEMFQLIKNGSTKTLKLTNDYFIRTGQRNVFEMVNKKYHIGEVQSIGTLPMEEGSSGVFGVAWLENKIYVVCYESNLVHVYPDQEPFDVLKDDIIEIKGMKDQQHMVASGVSRSIFISDDGSRCIWRIQMPSKEISRWEIDGYPRGLSINSSDELIVVVERGHPYIDVYRCEDGGLIKKIDGDGDVYDCGVQRIQLRILRMSNVVQSSNGNFIIVHRSRDDDRVDLISEVSIDGTKIIRSFDPRSIESNESKDWSPDHLSIDEDDNIFVADFHNARVVLLNPRLDEHQILVNRDHHQIVGPTSLCYVREKQMLIVGHVRSSSSVSLFSLSKHCP